MVHLSLIKTYVNFRGLFSLEEAFDTLTVRCFGSYDRHGVQLLTRMRMKFHNNYGVDYIDQIDYNKLKGNY